MNLVNEFKTPAATAAPVVQERIADHATPEKQTSNGVNGVMIGVVVSAVGVIAGLVLAACLITRSRRGKQTSIVSVNDTYEGGFTNPAHFYTEPVTKNTELSPIYEDIGDLPMALYDKADSHPIQTKQPPALVCGVYDTADAYKKEVPIYDKADEYIETADSIVVSAEDGYCVPNPPSKPDDNGEC